MTDKPTRITLSRAKGWKMPENTARVSRPSKFGNPYRVWNEEGFPMIVGPDNEPILGDFTWPEARLKVVELFRERCLDRMPLSELRGKNLACWCPHVDEHGNPFPCHADVLLELSNKPEEA